MSGSENSQKPSTDFRFFAWLLIPSLLLLFVWVSESQPKTERNVDFIYFYMAGQILCHFPPARLYDIKLQQSVCQALHPFSGHTAHYGYFSYPPFVALLFMPFAHFSFWTAYRAWQVLNLGLYGGGIALLSKRFLSEESVYFVLLLAISFCPFLGDTWINGQFSVCGFLGITFALCAQQRERDLQSGLTLSLCLYKPTLLLLLFPLIVATKQIRILYGLVLGGALLFLTTLLLLGEQVWWSYVRFLPSFQKMEELRPLEKYTDLIAFFSLLTRGRYAVALTLLCAAVALSILFSCAQRITTKPVLLWTTAITWTLLLNFYVPVYDTILLLPSVIASTGFLALTHSRATKIMVTNLFLASWLSPALLSATRLQFLSIAIAAFGVWQFRFCLRPITRSGAAVLAERLPRVIGDRPSSIRK